MKSQIFKTPEILKVKHKLSNRWFTINIPLFGNTILKLKNEEIDLVSKCLKSHLDWFKKIGILNETNLQKLTELSLFHVFVTSQIKGTPEERKIRECFTSIAILFAHSEEILDDTEEGKDSLKELYENAGYGANLLIGFLQDVSCGQYQGVEDLPEEALNFNEKLCQMIKCIQLRMDELKILNPQYKNTYKHLFDEGFKVIQATYILLINEKKQDLPIGSMDDLQQYVDVGSYYYELGFAYFEDPIPHKIRNHVYFIRHKNLFREIFSKINLLFGLGADFDNDTDYGWARNGILRKWRKDKPIEDLELLIKAEENVLGELLSEFYKFGEIFIAFFPNNEEVEDLVEFGKECYNSVVQAYYLSGRYTSKRKQEHDTIIEGWINEELQEPETFHCQLQI